jgi:hypothetical protein
MSTKTHNLEHMRIVEAEPRDDQTVIQRSSLFTRQATALLFMLVGGGWTGGNFTPAGMATVPELIELIAHFLPVALLLFFGVNFLVASRRGTTSRGAVIGISVLACISIIGCIVMIVLGFVNPDPNSVGVHNLNDWTPVLISNVGNLLWLSTLWLKRS